jgi:sulfur carrier protein
MIVITLNGAKCELADGTTLETLLTGLTGGVRGSAAVVDGEVVPRATWGQFPILEGQSVELVTAVQGG